MLVILAVPKELSILLKDKLTIGVDVPGEKVGDKSVPVTVTDPWANAKEKVENIIKKKSVVNILLILIICLVEVI